jgi:phosphonate transport system substrate-binding protein
MYKYSIVVFSLMNKYNLTLPLLLMVGIFSSIVANPLQVVATTEQQETVTLAIQPTAQAADIQAQGQELEQFLEERTGYDIEIYIPMSYAGVVEALRFGQADAAFLSAWPSYLAINRANASLELAEVREVVINDTLTNQTYYFSEWVTLPESSAESLEDLREMRAAFPSPLSTSGFVMPMYTLVNQTLIEVAPGEEVDPETFFSQVLFAGGYAQAWEALRNGVVDVSIIAGDVSEELYFEVINNTKSIHEQGPIPSHGVAFKADIDPTVKENLKAALLEIGNDEESRQLMRDLVSAIFVRFQETTGEEHLGSLTRALNATGLAFTEEIR